MRFGTTTNPGNPVRIPFLGPAVPAAVLASLVFLAACLSPGSRPPVALDAPGWRVRQGQALWRTEAKKPEIAGDVILSTHPAGGSSIQFLKTLPILSARVWPGGWEFNNTPENETHSGGGDPPKRVVWLQLLRALEGREVADRWTVARPSDRYIVLENPNSGERLELQFQE